MLLNRIANYTEDWTKDSVKDSIKDDGESEGEDPFLPPPSKQQRTTLRRSRSRAVDHQKLAFLPDLQQPCSTGLPRFRKARRDLCLNSPQLRLKFAVDFLHHDFVYCQRRDGCTLDEILDGAGLVGTTTDDALKELMEGNIRIRKLARGKYVYKPAVDLLDRADLLRYLAEQPLGVQESHLAHAYTGIEDDIHDLLKDGTLLAWMGHPHFMASKGERIIYRLDRLTDDPDIADADVRAIQDVFFATPVPDDLEAAATALKLTSAVGVHRNLSAQRTSDKRAVNEAMNLKKKMKKRANRMPKHLTNKHLDPLIRGVNVHEFSDVKESDVQIVVVLS